MIHQVLLDERPKELRDKDWDSREFVASSAVAEYATRKKADKEKKKYPVKNQGRKNSCAANTGALCLGIHEVLEGRQYVELSDDFIYHHRWNKGNPGMNVENLGKIGKDIGACLIDTLPKTLSDAEIDNLKITTKAYTEALQFRGLNYFSINSTDIDEYVKVCNGLGLPIGLFVWGSKDEYSKETPEVLDPSLKLEDRYISHLVTILPNTGHIYKGKKYVIIQDSSWFGGFKHRYISENWFKSRVVMGIYWTLLTEEPIPPTKPTVIPVPVLKVGSTGDQVQALQEALKYLGFFPNRPTTKYFGGLTYDAVYKYQESRRSAILSVLGLSKPTGIYGMSTAKQLAKDLA